jgi:serine/threonine protein kinase/formylglycine-generating enzyme required for sulfatase activity
MKGVDVDLDAKTFDATRTLCLARPTATTDGQSADGANVPESLKDLQSSTTYEVRSVLGRGGIGIVYSAHQSGLERPVALKVLKARRARDRGTVAAFRSEALITGLLNHPSIVPVHELIERNDGGTAFTMKQVSGHSWFELLHPHGESARKKAKSLTLENHLDILMSVCQAVAYAHQHGIIHRDIKPSNVMVGDFGEVLLMDWGMGISFRSPPPLPEILGRESVKAPLGSPGYMAPEMTVPRGDDLGPWTDIYLLGAVLYEILTGKMPHQGNSLFEVIRCAYESGPKEFPEDAPEELIAVCNRAMARTPSQRFASVEDFREAIRTFLRHRESHVLVESAHRRMKTVGGVEKSSDGERANRTKNHGRYEALADALAGFRQAQVLWSGNPKAIEGERRARLAWAKAALATGDLGLARSQLEGLSDPESNELSRSIDRARDLEKRKQRQVLRLRVVIATALALMIVGLIVGIVLINRERALVTRAAEETTDALKVAKANQARADAEALRATQFAAQVEEEAKKKIAATEAQAREEARADLNEERARELAKEALASAERADAEARESKRLAEQYRKAAQLAELAEAEAKENARKLAEEATARDRALADVQVYADAHRVSELKRRGSELLDGKDAAQEDLRAWIAEAQEVSGRTKLHEDLLSTWELDRATKEAESLLSSYAKERRRKRDAERRLKEGASGEERTTLLRTLEAAKTEVGRLQQLLADPKHYQYRKDREVHQHRVMRELVAQLSSWEEPDGLLVRAERKALQWEQELQRRAQDPRVWNGVRAAIRRHPAYGGIQIKDWASLYPLGQNPHSGLFEFLHLGSHRGAFPERGANGVVPVTSETGIVFVLIPGGESVLGAQKLREDAPHYDEQAREREGPVSKVPLAPYLISRYELTAAQWQRLAGVRATLDESEALLPATHLSYEQLQGLASIGLILPTEAQWEHAARGGRTGPWIQPRGLDGLVDFANLLDQAAASADANPAELEAWNDHFASLAPVGKLEPNAFGLNDVLGNVAEWCLDGSGSYGTRFGKGNGLRESSDAERVIRGGHFRARAREARVSAREFASPDTQAATVGARLAMAAELR